MSGLSIACIGGGISGLCTAIQVQKQLGVKTTIFEAGDDLGGTWYNNKYPGAACDIPSHLYSFSFEKNPNWSQRFSSQEEILQYLRDVAHKYGLYDQTRLNTEVISADWQEKELKWKLTVREKVSKETQTFMFDVVFAGLGPLHIAHIPEEFKSFEGPIVHSASWDSSLDFTRKRVAVIGSGASAVQIIPNLQPQVAHLTSYQRSPAWSISRGQGNYSNLEKFLFRSVPYVINAYRFGLFVRYEFGYYMFRYHKTLIGIFVRWLFAREFKNRILATGRPDMLEKLSPNYEFGCRRITPSENYLESLCESNVHVERSGIASVKGRTITTTDGREETFDSLVLCTGFNASGFLGNLQVNGRNNVNLNKIWDENYPATYKTIAVHGFPNLFVLLGPGSSLSHNSMVTMAEIQVNNAIKCLKQLQGDVKAIEPTLEAQNQFVGQLRSRLEKTVWTSCKSWYKNKRGEIFALWSSSVSYFYWIMRGNNFNRDFTKYTL